MNGRVERLYRSLMSFAGAIAIGGLSSLSPHAAVQATPPPEEAAEQAETPEQAEPDAAPEQAEADDGADVDDADTGADAQSTAAAPAPASVRAPERRGIMQSDLSRSQTIQIGNFSSDQLALAAWRASGSRPNTFAVGKVAGRSVAINGAGEVLNVIASPVPRSGPVQRPPSKPANQAEGTGPM